LPSQISDPSEHHAIKILASALKEPIRQLIKNKTALESEPILESIEREGGLFTGYDVKRECICDMVESGIVDSLLVVQTYLQDAVTLSGMLLTTEAIVYKEKAYTPLSLKHY
jgi:chaperonin GroEL